MTFERRRRLRPYLWAAADIAEINTLQVQFLHLVTEAVMGRSVSANRLNTPYARQEAFAARLLALGAELGGR